MFVAEPLPGFEEINRYWNPHQALVAAKLLPGEYYVTSQPEQLVATVGSTVAVLIEDARHCAGGLCHVGFPTREAAGALPGYGAEYLALATDALVNGMTRLSCRREHMRCTLVGGADTWLAVCGAASIVVSAVRDRLESHGLAPIVAACGGDSPRKVWLNLGQRAQPRVCSLGRDAFVLQARERRFVEALRRSGWHNLHV